MTASEEIRRNELMNETFADGRTVIVETVMRVLTPGEIGPPDEQEPDDDHDCPYTCGDDDACECAPPVPEADLSYHPFFDGIDDMLPGTFQTLPIELPAGVSGIRRMHNCGWDGRGADTPEGNGWTDRGLFDSLTGRVYQVYCREHHPTSVIFIEARQKADGSYGLSYGGFPAPPESGIGGRRPFDRLCLYANYLYFLPNSPRVQVGRLTRAHTTTPEIWEEVDAPPLPISVAANFNGDCSLTVNEETGRFYVNLYGASRMLGANGQYVVGGKNEAETIWDYVSGRLYSWAAGETFWRQEIRTQHSGRVGNAIYNRVHAEIYMHGGSTAYDDAHMLGGHCVTTVGIDQVVHRHGPVGLFVSTGKRRIGHCGKSGDYVVLDRQLKENPVNDHDGDIRIWIGDPTRNRPYRLMHRLPRGQVFSIWEEWHPVICLPGLDVIVWDDLERGPIRHKLMRWEDLEGAEELPIPQRGCLEGCPLPEIPDVDGPAPEPEIPGQPEEPPVINPPVVEIPDPVLPPPAGALDGSRLLEIGRSLAPGGLALLDPTYQDADAWASFRSRNTFAPGVSLPGDMTTWGGKGFFDRVRSEALVIGDRTPAEAQAPRLSFHAYSAGGHSVRHLDLSTLLGPLATTRLNDPGLPHPYNKIALDDAGRHFYYAPRHDQINQYLIDENAWEIIRIAPNGAKNLGPCCWHEGLGVLLTIDARTSGGGKLRAWGKTFGGWDTLTDIDEQSNIAHDGYHASFRYNRVRGDLLILGGNYNNDATNQRRVTLILPNGNVEYRQPRPDTVDGVPFNFGVSDKNLSECPVTGDYLLLDSTRRIQFAYQPDLDRWSIRQRWGTEKGSEWPGNYEGHMLVPVPGTDLSYWLSRHAPRVYRHAAG